MLHKELSQRMDAFERVCSQPIVSSKNEILQTNAADVNFFIRQEYVNCNLAALENVEPNAEDYFFMSKMDASK